MYLTERHTKLLRVELAATQIQSGRFTVVGNPNKQFPYVLFDQFDFHDQRSGCAEKRSPAVSVHPQYILSPKLHQPRWPNPVRSYENPSRPSFLWTLPLRITSLSR